MDAVYLDYAATTPLRDEVRAAMAPYESERFGNPSSLHRWGRAAASALEEARATTADTLGARPQEIYFVRGGTESDNLAVLGVCRALCAAGRQPTLLVSAVEHPAVLDAARHAERSGVARLVPVSVEADGSVDFETVERTLSSGPCVVTAMWVNNETGLLLPIAEVTARAHREGAIVHTDASQAVGKVHVRLDDTPVDLLTATGHKIYGPKGVGILYVRTGIELAPLIYGGGQERGLRPGTEDVAGAVGFAAALRLAVDGQEAEEARLSALRSQLEGRLTSALNGVRINAGDAERAPHVSSVGFAGIADGQALLMALDLEGVAVSGGSACASGSHKGSHVISALYGDDDELANVRYSFGLATTLDDVERAAVVTVDIVRRLRAA